MSEMNHWTLVFWVRKQKQNCPSRLLDLLLGSRPARTLAGYLHTLLSEGVEDTFGDDIGRGHAAMQHVPLFF